MTVKELLLLLGKDESLLIITDRDTWRQVRVIRTGTYYRIIWGTTSLKRLGINKAVGIFEDILIKRGDTGDAS